MLTRLGTRLGRDDRYSEGEKEGGGVCDNRNGWWEEGC